MMVTAKQAVSPPESGPTFITNKKRKRAWMHRQSSILFLLFSLSAFGQVVFHALTGAADYPKPPSQRMMYAFDHGPPSPKRLPRNESKQSIISSNSRGEKTANLTGSETTNASVSIAGTPPSQPKSARYAYAFVIGGCKPEDPAYRYFIYNVLVAARVLQRAGSQADVVVFFQMSHYSTSNELPVADVQLLQAMHVKIKYIPKSPQESFYRTVLDKFRILGLTEYRRVLLLDGDVIPMNNLDYLFEMSDGPNATLKENLIVAGKDEPANAGFFMLAPNQTDLEHINRIIQQRGERARELQYPYFDPVEGWGHAIEQGDQWEAIWMQGRNWTFWSAFADQGLLYHWVKYVKKSVSIVRKFDVQNWGVNANGTFGVETTLVEPFKNRTSEYACWKNMKLHCETLRRDYVHFTGRGKPWISGPPKDFSNSTRKWESAHYFWFYQLQQLDQELEMGLDFDNWTTVKRRRPSLGLNSMYNSLPNASVNLLEVAATF